MALSAHTMQWLSQSGVFLTFVDIEDGGRAVAYKKVPASCWINGQRFPHVVEQELRAHSFRTVKEEGLDYYLIPDSTTNSVGQVSHYGQAQSETSKPPVVKDAVPPPAVQKYLKGERKIKRLG